MSIVRHGGKAWSGYFCKQKPWQLVRRSGLGLKFWLEPGLKQEVSTFRRKSQVKNPNAFPKVLHFVAGHIGEWYITKAVSVLRKGVCAIGATLGNCKIKQHL